MIYYSKTSLLLIFIVAVTVCNFKLSNCQSNTCDDCPADCEYGLKQIKDSEGRCKCICAENPCLNRTCPERTKCKLRAVRNCQQGNCQLTMKPSCVLSIKAGFCPAPDIIDESTSAQCQDDSDCDGTFKCCPSLTRNSCSRSCAVTKCKCAADMVTRETYNKQGCPVCICSKEASNETRNDVCSLARQYGDCQSDRQHYYFDSQERRCKSFTYSGCGGNGNNFLTLEFCQRKCLPELFGHSNRKEMAKCFKPSAIGQCKGAFKRFYYNYTAQKCESFIYGGCEGNDNNFIEQEECDKICTVPIMALAKNPVLKCTQPLEIGNCRGAISRHFYNQTSQRCEEFTYSGCKGNGNNFESIDDCSKVCNEDSLIRINLIRGRRPQHGHHNHPLRPFYHRMAQKCTLKMDIGPCKGSISRYFYNTTSKKCEEFKYGGCEGNDNNFESNDQCKKECGGESGPAPIKQDKCQIEPFTGPCRGFFRRWFFNKTSQLCEEFIYGGCQKNENNFETKASCMKDCGSVIRDSNEKCSAVPEPGLCKGYFPKYFFNVTSQRCEQFIYGGCGGNENNYETVDNCKKSCRGLLVFERDVKPKCQFDMDKGDCRGNIKRFYFNRSTKKCEEFSYGGCGGNENNFESNELCLKECGSEQPSDLKSEKCSAAPEQGLCRGYFPKFFFNSTSQRCEQFIYGGCGGNENKYETSDECRKSCGGNQTREVSTTDKCAANPEPGLCRGYFPKFFFNVTSQRCEQFIYGGCGGNENNYESVDDCRKSCGGSTQTRNVPEKCTPQPDSGNCLAYIESFFYNITSQKCEQFIYGGCGGNENKFESSEQCTKECISPQTVQREANDDTICSLPSSTGSCKGNFEQFYFNVKSNKCEKFIYSGCGGNDNRFETEAQCNQKCSPKTQSNTLQPKCNQPVAPGNCRAYIESYFYNSTSKKCEFFVYGGCNGNDNNFVSVDECKKECGGGSESEIVTVERESPIDNKCDLAPYTGPCRGSFRRWFFNKTAQTCQEFIYGGCQKNENNFETKDDCIKGCGPSEVNVIRDSNEKCSAAPEQGLCRGYFPKFFFNATSQRCEQFIYGGCGGNENKYETSDECRKSCGGNQTREVSTTDKCAANPEPGLCRGYFPKYFFNVTSQRCEQFIYGGCGGNENNYESADDCRKSCGGSTQTRIVPEKCTPQPDSGNCLAYIERFFYNITSQTCEQFVYGGCGGNENNFETSDDCAKSCGGDLTLREATENDKCTAIADPGLCFGYFPKYFFNVTSQKCEKFIYGGCGGNENNYETVEQCKKSCSPLKTDRNVNIKCSLERHQGYCRDEILRYYYDAEAKKCQHFIYTGCGGNENNFETITDCENECDDSHLNIDNLTDKESSDLGKCSAKADSGLCRGYFPRFWFNPEKRECEQFVYGGCGGNENNYESIDDCRKSCGVVEIRAAENCTLKPDSGTCEALMKRFFFNVTSQKCEEFVYGGCGGNGNNYMTVDECKSSCVSAATPKKCVPQPDPGNCFANIPRFFYNITSKKCEEFIYGGCGGNENNFESSEQCLKECSVQLQSSSVKKFTDKTLCLLSPETGTCSGVIQKYYFNSQSKRCETFVYSGCGGNVNNFDNSEECVETCAKNWKPRRIEHLHTGD